MGLTVAFPDERVFLGSGLPPGPNTLLVKRYQFEDAWKTQVVEGHKLIGDIVNSVIAEEHRHLPSQDLVAGAKALYEAVFSVLNEIEEIPKIYVEPTEWERYREREASAVSELRLTEGVYLGLADTAKAAALFVFSFVTRNPVSWFSILKVAGVGGWSAYSTIAKYFIRLDGQAKVVFEAIHGKCSILDVVDYDKLESPISRNQAYGYLGPTTQELEEMVSDLSEKEIANALLELQGRNVITARQGRWYIRL